MNVGIVDVCLAFFQKASVGDNSFTGASEPGSPLYFAPPADFTPRAVPAAFSEPMLPPPEGNSRLPVSPRPSASGSTGRARYDATIGGLSGEDHYRLYIDRDRQHLGPECFDVREPGYARAMQESFVLVRDLVGEPLTVESYRMIHDAAVNGVLDTRIGQVMTQGFGPGRVRYGLVTKEVTPEARLEWHTEKLINVRHKRWRPDPAYLAFISRRHGISPSVHPRGDKALMVRRLQTILDQYSTDIVGADSELEKKQVIARACRALEIGHFFNDGNQRTVAFLVLNKMLIENDLGPVILPNPFVFDGYLSVDQLVGEIDKGQMIFREHAGE